MAKKQTGLTLVELMVTLAVAIILIAVGLPLFDDLRQNNTRTVVLNELVASLNYARSEAVTRGANVTICRRATGSTTACASAECANNHDNCWESGWLVFVDPDANGVVASSDDVLRAQVRDLREDEILSLIPTAGVNDFLTFAPTGESSAAGNYTYCDNRGAPHARAVILSNTGRLRLSMDSDANGTHDDDTGAELLCP